MKAKKSLGQNFLKSRKVVEKMIAAANVSSGDTVLEVGPGRGILTEALLERAGKVIAVEKDEKLVAFLREKFKTEIKNKKLCLLSDDILKIDVYNLCFKFQVSSFKVVANIPYYITGEFLRKFLSSENQPQSMTLLVQKEVALRIVARDGKESILSISVKAYGKPRYIEKVKAREFSPEPKVDSAILHTGGISKDFFHLGVTPLSKKIDEKTFFLMVKTGFAHKRKLLINNLKRLYSDSVAKQAFEKCKIAQNARAEDVSLDGWKCLYIYVS